MIQRTVVTDLEDGIYSACPDFGCSVNQPLNSGIDHRSGAHRARFNGHVQCRFRQTIVGDSFRRSPDSQNFRMSRRVIQTNRLIMPASDNLFVNHHHSANRNFASVARSPGFCQSKAHKKLIERIQIRERVCRSRFARFCLLTLVHCCSGAPKKKPDGTDAIKPCQGG